MQIDPLSDGWGATTDGRHLIVSDGTATLTFLDPDTLSKMKSIVVSDNGSTVPMLNEVCCPDPELPTSCDVQVGQCDRPTAMCFACSWSI